MKLLHFETLRPVCPVCRTGTDGGMVLRLAHVAREENGQILEGALHCPNLNCQREYPIIDGLPLIVANIRRYIADNVLALYARRDLTGFVESMIGDCCGPGSSFEITRQQLSSYTWDHYGDLDPAEPAAEPRPGSMLKTLKAGLELAGVAEAARQTQPQGSAKTAAGGPALDAGCSVGRGTFALAEQTAELVLGVDLHLAMLRMASEVLRQGTVRYARRRLGLVYDRREFAARFARADNVDFWACDATALPFAPETFGLAASINTLDCVAAPRELLASLGNVLKPGAKAVLSCPYDWSPTATPVEAWLGGHSQRSPAEGSPEAALRTLLTPGGNSGPGGGLRLIAEADQLPWHVRLHDRSAVTYRGHLVVAQRPV